MNLNPGVHPVVWLEKKPMLAWALVGIYASIIFIFSSMPYPPQPVEGGDESTIKLITTIEHAIEYSILGFLLLAGFRGGGRSGAMRKNAVFLAIALATLYGITDEIHQSFVPSRDCSIWDVLTDCVGACLGVFIGRPRNSD